MDMNRLSVAAVVLMAARPVKVHVKFEALSSCNRAWGEQ